MVYFSSFNKLYRSFNGHYWDSLSIDNPRSISWEDGQLAVLSRNLLGTENTRMFISHDEGKTFFESPLPMQHNGTSQVVVLNQKLFFHSNISGKLFFSQNQGMSWDSTDMPLSACSYCWLQKIDGQIYTRAYNKIWKFNWSAFTWDEILLPLQAGDEMYGLIVSKPFFENLAQVGGKYYINEIDAGFFVSLDSAQTWYPLNQEGFNSTAIFDSVLYVGARSLGKAVQKSIIPDFYHTNTQGMVFLDLNGDSVKEVGEPPVPFARVYVNDPNVVGKTWYVFSNLQGNYALHTTKNGGDTIRVDIPGQHSFISAPPFYLADQNPSENNFAIQFTEDISDVQVYSDFQSRPRPGFENICQVSLHNRGTKSVETRLSIQLDPNFAFQYAEPAPTAVFGLDSLVWEGFDVALFEIAVHAEQPLKIEISAYVRPQNPSTNMRAIIGICICLCCFWHCQRNSKSALNLPPEIRASLRDTAIGYPGCDPAQYRKLPDGRYEYYYPGCRIEVTPQFNNATQKIKVVSEGVKTGMDFTEKNIVFFAGVSHNKYFFDMGIGGDTRETAVYSATNYLQEMRTHYIGDPPVIKNGVLHYLYSIGELAARSKGVACPEAETWKSQGKTVGYGEYWTFDLSTLSETNTGKFTCVILK